MLIKTFEINLWINVAWKYKNAKEKHLHYTVKMIIALSNQKKLWQQITSNIINLIKFNNLELGNN